MKSVLGNFYKTFGVFYLVTLYLVQESKQIFVSNCIPIFENEGGRYGFYNCSIATMLLAGFVNITEYLDSKMYQCWGLSSQLLQHELPPTTTIPGLPRDPPMIS